MRSTVGFAQISNNFHFFADLPESVLKRQSDSDDETMDFRCVKWLISEKKLATVPSTGFCTKEEHKKIYEKYIRLCFFKQDSTLEAAGKKLREWTK